MFEDRGAELRRARRPRQPPGASSAEPRRRARDLVGLLVERSPEMVVGLLGILKAGGAYLPLDPNYPRERLAVHAGRRRRRRAGDASRRCSTGCRRRSAATGSSVRLDADWPAIARQPATAPPLDARSRATRPTSSTPRAPPATPKGVVVSHGALQQLPRLDGGAGAAHAGRPAARRHHHRLRHRGARALPAAARRRLDRADAAARRVQDAQALARDDRRRAAPPSCRRRRRCGRALLADERRARCRISKALPC